MANRIYSAGCDVVGPSAVLVLVAVDAICRRTGRPATLRQVAAACGVCFTYAKVQVDRLERLGLVRRPASSNGTGKNGAGVVPAGRFDVEVVKRPTARFAQSKGTTSACRGGGPAPPGVPGSVGRTRPG